MGCAQATTASGKAGRGHSGQEAQVPAGCTLPAPISGAPVTAQQPGCPSPLKALRACAQGQGPGSHVHKLSVDILEVPLDFVCLF